MAAAPQQAIVRLDRSRDYSTVHGDRLVGDPHYNVHFYQHGLPYGPDERLLFDHAEVQGDPKKKALAEKLIKRAAKKGPSTLADSGGPTTEGPVNLVAWAMGEQDVVWQDVTNAIARRFSVRVANKTDALELLMSEHVVAKDQLSDEFAKLFEDD
jgi:hypothetical protein